VRARVREAGLPALAAETREKIEGGKGEGFPFYKNTQTIEFKQEFEFNHSKQWTSMYATVNSYISLFIKKNG
jgi:hypothetical protein